MSTSASDSLVINDTSYAGDFAPYFILPAIYGLDTVNKNAIFVKDGIKKQHTIGKMDFTNPWQPRVADPVASGGDITINGNVLAPKDQMLFQLFNPRDLEVHWESEKLSQTLLARELPQTIESYIMALVIGRAFEQVENQIWTGSTQYANNTNVSETDPRFQLQFVDGFIKKFLNDSSIYQAGSAVTLTSSNIITAMFGLYQAVAANNKALIASPNKYKRMKFLVSINSLLLFEEAQVSQPFKNIDMTRTVEATYKGFDVVALAGMPDNTIVFTEALPGVESNIWFGINSISDENLQMARWMNSSERFFLKMLWKSDVNYGFSNKIFLYTTLTTSSFIA